eukprot:CAMPEP_0184380778 /NCGR_PEP_ID=MMETSP0007-20130409/5045_1 /TAXON_ID=97485 /ORGANISM="Prymnesium parvum, Strain Texoma1" /LENGTH=54 /DNA_ID=CAMNT_0026726155 /DNA_START=274 /DNA_END=435 /DNA_ORIENTATION=+
MGLVSHRDSMRAEAPPGPPVLPPAPRTPRASTWRWAAAPSAGGAAPPYPSSRGA